MPRVLFGTAAHHEHAQQIAQALYEEEALGLYQSLGVDHYESRWLGRVRTAAGKLIPSLNRTLQNRRVTSVPTSLVRSDWTWELPRVLAARLGLPGIADWLWERSEWKLDRNLAAQIQNPDFDALLGVEHGCLKALQVAKKLGKPSAVTFTSPHHSALEKWVYQEYERFPELLSPTRRTILNREPRRYQRKDEEAECADFIHANSSLTKKTLLSGGHDPEKIHVAPLGCPSVPDDRIARSGASRKPPQIIFAGSLSVRKGIHYLIEAWSQLDQSSNHSELHCYGRPLIPDRLLDKIPPTMRIHGFVSKKELFDAFKTGSALVLPTLLDGFGMVITEALAHGLPVITTPNAGAADLIEEGRNGFLVPPGNADALADRLDWCCRHPDKLSDMRDEALEKARNWQWSDFRRRLWKQLQNHLFN